MTERNVPAIAIYCRVSTDEQAKEGVSLEEQQERLAAYCKAMGWNDSIRKYVDDGYSAKNLDRPALQRLLSDVQNGRVSRLMVTKLDRLSRRLLDLLTLIELLQKHEVSFVSTSESFDTESPSGRLTLQVLGAVAEFERERIRERVSENMLHAARNGKWLTQHPYGYRLYNKELAVYEPEAAVVRRVFDLFQNQGRGYYAIAKQLNDERIPSRTNKAWSINTVKKMLTNPVYAGILTWNRTDSSSKTRQVRDESEWVVIYDAHPSIVDALTWQQVQHAIHNRKGRSSRAQTSPHLLSGLLRCGMCGASMSISWSGHPKRRRVYRCSAYKNQGTCKSTAYDADTVELWFKRGLGKLLTTLDPLVYDIAIPPVQEQQLARLAQRVKAVKARYARQVSAYEAGLMELEDLKRAKQEMEQETAKYNRQFQAVSTSREIESLTRELSARSLSAVQALDELPLDVAKARLQTLVERVILHGKENLEIVMSMDFGSTECDC
ncbi:recombinase family protein [Alicyclobacillus tolerans]|uniref:recombinase family protein n=1 Tax=Alicyclobacillus tolerans TaxID=90970 RepID=UPI001F0071FB|nr:recombinase family protein [Alicyclobacillus tolerans]MCF8563918.1 recombinase family protein [Alicyclobacillus tolerans]